MVLQSGALDWDMLKTHTVWRPFAGRLSLALLLLHLWLDTMIFSDSPIIRSEFLYESAPFPSCHASTIVETRSGVLVCSWFGGTAESHPDVVIYTSRFENGTWSKPAKTADGVQGNRSFPCYNPVLFQPSKGPLLLFYKFGTGPQTWHGRVIRSLDEGKTWSGPEDLPVGILGPIKNKPIEIHGAILCPSSSEDHSWQVHMESSRDYGKTWDKTNSLNEHTGIGAIQPSLLRLKDGGIRALGRTQQGKMFVIDSSDEGRSWGLMRLIDVPNPNSGTDAVTLASGEHLLVYNKSATHRTPLNVALSHDGEHWKPVLVLEDKPGEYSYPAVIQARDGLVHITYTWNRTHIRHVVLNPMKLDSGKKD